MAPLDVTLAGETVRLLPHKALYWPRQRTLFVADVHLGKADTFRSAGIAVPRLIDANLTLLSQALATTGAERLVCLGDWLHARQSKSVSVVEAVTTWRQQHATLEFMLVAGNHDQQAGVLPTAWQMTVVEEPFAASPFILRHFPKPHDDGYVLSGHLHPAVSVGRGKLAQKVACFHFGRNVGVLPAFGAFTGTAHISRKAHDGVYLVVDDDVLCYAPYQHTV